MQNGESWTNSVCVYVIAVRADMSFCAIKCFVQIVRLR